MNRVYVLGSGFSVTAGAPLARSVLNYIFHPARLDGQLRELKAYLDDFLFQGRPDWTGATELEEVLSRLDLIRHYKPYPGIDYARVVHFEELLLAEFTRLLSPALLSCSHPAYKAFGKLLCPADIIISFNYDLVVEDLLTSSGLGYDYQIGTIEGSLKGTKPVTLLKLHGSINLYYCPACGKVFFFSPTVTEHPVPEGETAVPLVCRSCSSPEKQVGLRHFIIAPTLFKSYTLPALRQLWFRALKSLSDAGEIYFIGYSLPEADILSYQLFDYGRSLAGRKQTVHLVNGHQLQPGRFEQIYGADLVNEGLYFEEWVSKAWAAGLEV